jgi:hypothetical protein
MVSNTASKSLPKMVPFVDILISFPRLTNLAPDDNQTVNIAIPDTEELGVGMVMFTTSQSLNITWYFNGTTSTVLASGGQEQQRSSLHFWGAFILLALVISF